MERGITRDNINRGSGMHQGYPPHVPSPNSPPPPGMMLGTRTSGERYEPDAYLEPTHNNNNNHPSLRHKTGSGARPIEQHDSGVADIHLDSYRKDRLSSTPSSPDSQGRSSNPRGMNGFLHHPHPVSHNQPNRPDSLAYTNEYEELPSAKYLDPSGKYSYATGEPVPGLSTPSLHRAVPEASPETLGRGNSPDRLTYRKRQNPLYEDTNFGHSTGLKDSADNHGLGTPNCFCPILILLGILSSLTFILVMLIITRVLPGSAEPEFAYVVGQTNMSSLQSALEKMDKLQAKYDDLLEKYHRLQKIVGPLEDFNDTSIDRGLLNSLQFKIGQLENQSDSVQTVLDQLHSDQSEIASQIVILGSQVEALEHHTDLRITHLYGNNTQQVAAVNSRVSLVENRVNNSLMSLMTDLSNQINDFSKMPGPQGLQGPPGVGNLSMCGIREQVVGGSSALPITSSDWLPSASTGTEEIQNQWIILGATCSTEGGTIANLRVQTLSGLSQYRCECSGGDGPNRYCTMYYWICPRIS